MKLQFGDNFKRLRKQREITQEQVAEMLGVSCQSVSRWELGVCYPDFELLPIIANCFEVTIDSLLSNDDISKETDKKLFFEKLDALDWQDMEQLDLAKKYCYKYPADPQYKWHLVNIASNQILIGNDKNREIYKILKENAEKLLDTQYRDWAIERMVVACSEEDLENWLDLCPYTSTFNRRGCIVSRYSQHTSTDDKQYIHQGLENLEKFSNQLDRRFPDCFGSAKKSEYHYKILNIIESFGNGTEVPDGWKLFYAYKQLVLSACLFDMGKYDEGWNHFDSAINKYKYIFTTSDKWLDLGGELFANLKANKTWTTAVNESGEEYELFGISHLSFYNINFLYGFLNDPRWAWFNSVRETDKYKNAIKWAEEIIKAEQKA